MVNGMQVLVKKAREVSSYEESVARAWAHFCEGPEHTGSTVFDNSCRLLARELGLPDEATDDEIGDAALAKWFPECHERGHLFRREAKYRAVCARCQAVNTDPHVLCIP